jgi:hypothetical protein
MTPDELTAAVDSGEIDTVIVGFTDHYGLWPSPMQSSLTRR